MNTLNVEISVTFLNLLYRCFRIWRQRDLVARARRTCNLMVLGSNPHHTTLWICLLPTSVIFASLSYLSTFVTLILTVCRTRFIYELRNRSCPPLSLCGSVAEHRSVESDGLSFDSSWEIPTLVTRRKKHLPLFL